MVRTLERMVDMEVWQTTGSSRVGLRGFGLNVGVPPGVEVSWMIHCRDEKGEEGDRTNAEDDFVGHLPGLVNQSFGHGFLVFGVALNDYQLGLRDVLLDTALGE